MIDEFDVKPIFEDRPYERHQFKFKIDGSEYKGDFHDNEIHWLNPHPKQELGEARVSALEAEIHILLGEHGVKDEIEDVEVKKLYTDHNKYEAHEFKLKIHGEEFKGLFRDDQIEWFHPQPKQKIKDEQVEKVEEKVSEKIKEHMEVNE